MRGYRRSLPARSALPIAIVLALAGAGSALAATCTVNSNNDDPFDATEKVRSVDSTGWNPATTITLRDCIVAANLMTGAFGEPTTPGMDIDLNAIAGQTITLSDALPLVFNNTSIDAGNGAPVTVSGNNVHRVFFISGLPPLANGNVVAPTILTTNNDDARPVSVAMHRLVISNGLARGGDSGLGGGGMGAGGGIFINKNATVSLTDVSFSGNKSLGGISGFSQPNSLGGGGMGPGVGGKGGGGLGNASTTLANRFGGGGLALDSNFPDAGGFGGTGLGQLSVTQNFDVNQFGITYFRSTHAYVPCCLGYGRIGEGGNQPSALEAGFGGGGGGLSSNSHPQGGFGGGGGFSSAVRGGDGGFGGGGAYSSKGGGNGGFGAGGGEGEYFGGSGFHGGTGGIGGGAGSDFNQAGGGGAGFGGALFVRTGGALTLHGSSALSISGGTSTGGTANKSGAAAGAGMFLMSGSNTVFDIDSVATISDNIDDESNIVLEDGNSYTQGCPTGADPACGSAFSKTGRGTLVTNGRVYALNIIIDAGTVEANGQFGYSAVHVNAGGRLSGTGTPAPVTLSAGGILSPGKVTTTGNLGVMHPFQVSWHSQGIAEFRLSSTQATSSTISVNSLQSISGDSGLRSVRVLIGTSMPMVGVTYNLANCSSRCMGFPSVPLTLADFAIDPASTVHGTLGLSMSHLTLTVTEVISDRIFYGSMEY
jgi:hypothetical protein